MELRPHAKPVTSLKQIRQMAWNLNAACGGSPKNHAGESAKLRATTNKPLSALRLQGQKSRERLQNCSAFALLKPWTMSACSLFFLPELPLLR